MGPVAFRPTIARGLALSVVSGRPYRSILRGPRSSYISGLFSAMPRKTLGEIMTAIQNSGHP